MGIANYTSGFPGGVLLRGMSILQTNPGKVFWVSNVTTGLLAGQRGGSNGNRGDWNSPFATLNYAITQCVADRGDIIFIKPGHAETVSTATALNFNVAGVAIVGLGLGTNRPKFTIDTGNGSTIPVTANNISIQNCQFFANFLSIAACFTVAAAKEFTVQGCYFNDTSSVLNFLNIVKSTGAANTADGLTFNDNQVNNLGVTSNNTCVLSANDIDRLTINRNKATFAIQNDIPIFAIITAGVVTNCEIGWNLGYRPNTQTSTGGTIISVGGTTSTGWVHDNYIQTLDTSTDLIFTATVGLGGFENYVSGVLGASGFIIPARDS